MKILHVESGRHLYGGPVQVLLLLRGLRAKGIENVLVCPEDSAIARARPAAELRKIPMGGDLDLSLARRLRTIIREIDPDIIHLHSRRGADWIGGLAALRFGIPVVLSRRVDNRESRIVAATKYALVDHIVAISQAIYRVLLEAGIREHKLSCVPSAVPPKGEHARNRAWLQQQFNIPADATVIALIGQLIERKGHSVLLEVLPDIIEQHPDVRVLFLGDGARRNEIQRQIESMDLGAVVSMPGFRVDLEQILPNLDLVVHPALREGLGIAVLQALQAGLPVVASAAGGLPEAVVDGQTGLLVPANDVVALKLAILRMLADRQAAAEYGRRGAEYVAAEFSVEQMVAGNLAVYRDL